MYNRAAPLNKSSDEPAIVVVGGGHGLSTLLRGLARFTDRLTAIVTVADDGGSSGQLRREMGILPPGDLRNCIAALAQAEPLMQLLFQYRFGHGTGLDGHAFGNLFIAAMAGITGSFESAIQEASRLLAVRGRILPSSLEDVMLCAEMRRTAAGQETSFIVCGESQIGRAGGRVERVYLQPADIRGYPEAIRALLNADMIVLGPGSLYTSILPNLLVRDIQDALQASPAAKVYVCNVATEPGETDGYTVRDHVEALSRHLGQNHCHYVLANSSIDHRLPTADSQMVHPICAGNDHYHLILEDIVDRRLPWRHDSDKLADALLRLCHSV